MVEEAASRLRALQRRAVWFLVPGLLVWLISLGGMAALLQDCHSGQGGYLCIRGFQFQWWGVWFEFILLVGTAIAIWRRFVVENALALLALFSICTTVLMVCARELLSFGLYRVIGNVGFRTQAVGAAAGGFIIDCIVNILLIFLLSRMVTAAAANGGAALDSFSHSSAGAAKDLHSPLSQNNALEMGRQQQQQQVGGADRLVQPHASDSYKNVSPV